MRYKHDKRMKRGDRVQILFSDGWYRATVVRHYRYEGRDGIVEVVYDKWKKEGAITLDDWVAHPLNAAERLAEL